MANTFLLEIVTPTGPFFTGQVESLILPATDGSYGVEAGHEPVVAAIEPGETRYKVDGVWTSVIVTHGFAEIMSDYASIFAFFLMGCVFVAVGMFISALTESQIIAAVGTFAALLTLYLWDSLMQFLPDVLSNVLGLFSFSSVLYNFAYYSVFDVRSVVLYLTLAGLFVFLTVQALQKRRWN